MSIHLCFPSDILPSFHSVHSALLLLPHLAGWPQESLSTSPSFFLGSRFLFLLISSAHQQCIFTPLNKCSLNKSNTNIPQQVELKGKFFWDLRKAKSWPHDTDGQYLELQSLMFALRSWFSVWVIPHFCASIPSILGLEFLTLYRCSLDAYSVTLVSWELRAKSMS